MKNLLSLVIAILSLSSLSAQWKSMEGPYGGLINDLKSNEQYQFPAATGGLFRSENEGETWSQININGEIGFACIQIGIKDSTLIIDIINAKNGSLQRKLYKSEDNGTTWKALPRPNTSRWLTIGIIDNGIYLSDYDKIWNSFDQGKTWALANINTFVHPIQEFTTCDNHIYLISGTKIFRTTDTINQFMEIDLPPFISGLVEIYADGDLILGEGINGKLYRSSDGGQNWVYHNINLHGIGKFAKIGNTYFTKNFDTMYKSEDGGINWIDLHSNELSINSDLMIASGENLFVSIFRSGIQSSHDLGVSFHEAGNGIISTTPSSLLIHKGKLYTGSDYNGITSFDFETSTWDSDYMYSSYSGIGDLAIFNDDLYAITESDLLKSINDGQEWNIVTPDGFLHFFQHFYLHHKSLLAGGTYKGSLYISDYEGDNWYPYTCEVYGAIKNPQFFTQTGDTIFAARKETIYRSLNNGFSWDTLINTPILGNHLSHYSELYFLNQALFIIETVELQFTHYNRLHISYDNGDHWQLSTNGIPATAYPHGVRFITNLNGILIASLDDNANAVRVSYDNGQTWQKFDEGLSWGAARKIIYDDTYLYMGSSSQGVFRRKISDLLTTSIDQPVLKNEISIFPNPSTGDFTISLSSEKSGDANVTITDMNGRVCKKLNIEINPETEIETGNLSSGLYFVILQTGGHIFTSKLVIQH